MSGLKQRYAYSFELNHYITTILSIYMSFTEISSSLSLELGYWPPPTGQKKKKSDQETVGRGHPRNLAMGSGSEKQTAAPWIIDLIV